jgi:N-acetylglutamate synthase-like GNAT family acetyltransferase
MKVTHATLADLPYIEHLSRLEGETIGFVPKSRYEIEVTNGGSILVAWENDDPIGFLYATHNQSGVTRIQQVAIQEDARRMERATALVQAAQRENDWLISARCASNLEATEFWRTLGFENRGIVPPRTTAWNRKHKDGLPSRRKRTILSFQKVIGGLWLPIKAIT